jgi:hypothetical protein
MEVDLEVSKSVGNVNIISEKALLIHKPTSSLNYDQVCRINPIDSIRTYASEISPRHTPTACMHAPFAKMHVFV